MTDHANFFRTRTLPRARAPLSLFSLFLVGALMSVAEPLQADDRPLPADTTDTLHVAHLDIVVESTASTAAGALSQARFLTRTVTGALMQSGAEIRELEVNELEVSPIFERRVVSTGRRPLPPPRVKGYGAWGSITIVTPAVARVDALIDGITGAGGYVQAITYETLVDPPREAGPASPGRPPPARPR